MKYEEDAHNVNKIYEIKELQIQISTFKKP